MADYDPYDMNNYYTPSKGGVETTQKEKKTFNPYETQNKKVFNPYQTKQQEEDMPDFVDMTKDVYAQKNQTSNNTETDEELPLLEG